MEWFSQTTLQTAAYRLLLLLCFALNAYATCADIRSAVLWIGLLPHTATLFAWLAFASYFLLYASGIGKKHDETRHENALNKAALHTFIRANIETDYLTTPSNQSSNAQIPTDHLILVYTLTAFHFFKKSLSDAATEKHELDDQQPISDWYAEMKEQFSDIENANNKLFTTMLPIYVTTPNDADKNTLQRRINYICTGYVTALSNVLQINPNKAGTPQKPTEKRLERQKTYRTMRGDVTVNSYDTLVTALDNISLYWRNQIIAAINDPDPSDEDGPRQRFFRLRRGLTIHENAQLPILQQLLKLEHTYTLREQRTALPVIRGFGLLNAVVNACLMLASGFLSIGGSSWLGAFACAGFFSSFILTRPKVYSVVQHIIGHIMHYLQSNHDARAKQRPSLIFYTAWCLAFITASSSALFTFYSVQKYAMLFSTPILHSTVVILGYLLPVVIFVGATCLYYDAIFASLSGNKKDIYAPEDNLQRISIRLQASLCDIITEPKKRLYLVLMVLSIVLLCRSIYFDQVFGTTLALLSTSVASSFVWSDIHTWVIVLAFAAGLGVSFASLHQVTAIWAIPSTCITRLLAGTFMGIQTTTLTCTFSSNIRQSVAKIEQYVMLYSPEKPVLDTEKKHKNESPKKI